MSISSAQATFGAQALGTPSRPNHSGSVIVGLTVATMPLDDSDMIFTNRAEIPQDKAATLDLADFTVGTIGDVETGTAILNPTGVNNAIKITSTDTDVLAAEILIDDDVDRTGLSVTGGSLLSAVSGDKRVMRIGGTLTDGDDPVVFPDLVFSSDINGKPSYAGANLLDDIFEIIWTGTYFQLQVSFDAGGDAEWRSTEDVATPDLVTTWTPEAPATGTPTVTAHPATAAQLIAAINAEEIEGVTAANAPGNDGTGTVATVESTSLNYVTVGASWTEPTTDFEGTEYPLTETITAISVACISGGVSVEIGGIASTLAAGGKFQIANNAGCAGNDQVVEITGIEANSEIDIAVIAESQP